MSWFDHRTARVVATLTVFVAAAAFLYIARRTLVLFLFAILLAYLLQPAVAFMQQRIAFLGHSRVAAIAAVYLLLVIAVVLVGVLIGQRLVSQARYLGASLPSLAQRLTSGQIAWQFGQKRGWSYETQQHVQEFLAAHQPAIIEWFQRQTRRVAQVAANALWFLLVPVLAIFFLKDGPGMTGSVVKVVERRRQRKFLSALFADLDQMLARYIRAQLTLAAFSMAFYISALEVLRVPYAIVLGVVAGVLEFVPVLGPLIAAISIIGIALVTDYRHLVWLGVLLAAWRIAQDYVIAPRIMGRQLELHPLAAIFAVLVGGEVAGVLGVFLSIPAMATLRILWRRLQTYAEEQPGRSSETMPRAA